MAERWTLEEQILEPVAHPDEMALPWTQAISRLQADASEVNYPEQFLKAFGTSTITPELTVKAIAQFLRTLISSDSKFDQWRRGETNLTDDEFAGYEMFLREGGDPETTTWWTIWRGLFPLPYRSRIAVQRLSFSQQRLRQFVRFGCWIGGSEWCGIGLR